MRLRIAKKTLFILVLIILCLITSWAQSSVFAAQPANKQYAVQSIKMVDLLEITDIDVEKARMEDAAKKAGNFDKGLLRVGLNVEVEVNTGGPRDLVPKSTFGTSRGTWEEIELGLYLWRLRVTSPGALWLSFGFTQYQLPADATLFIYSPDGEWVAGPYSSNNNSNTDQLWTPMISGDEAIIELTVKETSIKDVLLMLGSVTHGYHGVGTEPESLDKSGSCNVDVICSQGNGWRDQIRSVGRYSFSSGASSYVCTGSLVNNTSQDGTPYFLTANHCVNSQTGASTVVVYWEYESSTCRTPGSSESGTTLPRPSTSQSGAIWRASYSPSDVTLLELISSPKPSWDVYWSGWDRTGTDPTSAVCIHHPKGHAKRISHENNPLTTTSYGGFTSPGDSTHFRVEDWDSGTTEGGSSGSGLWDANKRIVGQLHGGYAACGNDLPDYYGRLYTSWTGGGTSSSRLSNWLDKGSTGASTLDGFDGSSIPPITPTAPPINPIYSLLLAEPKHD